MLDFKTRKGGSRKTVDLKDAERLQPFNSKEVQFIFDISHETSAKRKRCLGIIGDEVGWAELNLLYLVHIFVSSKYPHHTYYQFQNLYSYCLKKKLSIEKVVFKERLMLDIEQLLEEFKSDVIQRITTYRRDNSTGTFRVIPEPSETPNPGGTAETA
jgi:hypothetical protein